MLMMKMLISFIWKFNDEDVDMEVASGEDSGGEYGDEYEFEDLDDDEAEDVK
ncbi:hypothetical protein A2U01_0102553, partial [Trifolium medium]|nr:hypothetical protein [Trifolium medium]